MFRNTFSDGKNVWPIPMVERLTHPHVAAGSRPVEGTGCRRRKRAQLAVDPKSAVEEIAVVSVAHNSLGAIS